MDARVRMASDAVMRGNGVRALEHLVEADISDPTVWRLRSAALALLSQHAEAEDACRRGLALAPGDAELQIELARRLASQDRGADAEHAYLSVLNQFPEHVEALHGYGWLLASAGDASGARQVLTRVDPLVLAVMPSFLALQGYVAMIEGRRADAQDFLDRGLAAAPESGSMYHLQSLQASLGQRQNESLNYLELAAQMDPDGSSALGREARFWSHPLLAMNRLAGRVGPMRLWFIWLAVLYGLPRIWPSAPMNLIIIVWVILAVWSWIGPTIMRRWFVFRGRL